MKDRTKIRAAFPLIALIILFGVGSVNAQSNDPDAPTELKSSVIEAEGDGKAETVYYSFTAGKGTLKVTVDAKTDDRSTPQRVTLMDDDGKELLPMYIVATGAGRREVASRKFVRVQRVVIKIVTQNDPQITLLTYKIKLEGSEVLPPDFTDGSSNPIEPDEAEKTSTFNWKADAASKPLRAPIE